MKHNEWELLGVRGLAATDNLSRLLERSIRFTPPPR